jgi:hypothetical protein
MLATLYSGQSAIFTSFINLVQGSRDRNCNASGSIDAVLVEPICKDADSTVFPCTVTDDEENKKVANPVVAITTTEPSAIFYRCQDGITSGSYFDGPLRVVLEDDFSVNGIYINTTTVSAVAQISQQSEDGKFVLNANDEVVKVEATDFLMQNELNTFFMSQEYNLTTTYDTSSDRFEFPGDLEPRDISECTTADVVVDGVVTKLGTSIVTSEVLKTDLVAGLQEPSPQFSYTEFTDLNLTATKTNFRCEDEDAVNGDESLRFDTAYSLSTGIESKALGTDTQFTWTDLVIPTNQKNIEGTIVLTHTNQNGPSPVVVTVVFNKLGSLTVNGGPQMSVQDFLNLSKAEVVAE